MDAVSSFLRDARNWLITITIVLIIVSLQLLSWLWERTDKHEETSVVAQAPTPVPTPPAPVSPVVPLDPTIVCISPYWLPDEPAELHALVDGLPAGTPLKFGDVTFTAGEIASIADVWERAGHLRT